MTRKIEKLNRPWKFAIDAENKGEQEHWQQNGLPSFKEVSIPHTFNVEPELFDYRGVFWYEYRFIPNETWRGKRVRIQFNGVYRDVDIWLNGHKIGSHYGSGYTAFTIDTAGSFEVGTENLLIVKGSNSYSENALPYGESFDWADDGGIFREVVFIITGKLAFDHIQIHANPVIPSYGKRYSRAEALWRANVILCPINPEDSRECQCTYEIYQETNESKRLVAVSENVSFAASKNFAFPEIKLDKVELWHFDFPHLYKAVFTLKYEGEVMDEVSMRFGFREFITQKHRFLLNGEYVRLCGTEWMPGSNPAYGNAEPKEYMIKILRQLKETNCVFTRFHWQQDEAVYDWCDENGMLVQEEVPHWGKVAENPGNRELQITKQQIDEMTATHFNHPSIMMWGVGNELRGQDEEMRDFLGDAIAYARSRDPERQVNYVTNTMFTDPSRDASRLGDVLMVNEYIGTWHGDLNLDEEFNKIIAVNPERPIVITEFGLCEPAHVGGDRRRSQLFIDKMTAYAKYPEIAGTINFCLNDYRTQMGEEGSHNLKRRVHGSTDIFGEPKPSYYVVQRGCSPLRIQVDRSIKGVLEIHLVVKDTLPSYGVDQYSAAIWNEEGKINKKVEIPMLKPGEKYSISTEDNATLLQIRRPNGFLVEERHLQQEMD